MNRKKVLLLVASICISLLMMTACGETQQEEQAVAETIVIEVPQEEPTQNGDIGADRVKEIVLAKVPGATEDNIDDFEKEYDDGRLEYEGSIYYGGYEYEFEVDGETGTILQWEIDD